MAMLGLGREDWVICVLCSGGVGWKLAGQQKTPPLRCGVLRFGACCLRARSSRTCRRGNKDEYEDGRRGGGVVVIPGGGVAMQHLCKLNRPFTACQAVRARAANTNPLPWKSLQP